MRIILTMVGISLGLVIAVVAGVYGWQRYEESRPPKALIPMAAAPPPAPEGKSATPAVGGLSTPSPVSLPVTATPPPTVAPAPKTASPATASLPVIAPAPMAIPAPGQTPSLAGAQGATGAEDQPIAEVLPTAIATPEKLQSLQIGMTEGDVRQTMGTDGIETPEEQLPEFTPAEWYELRWANADGSYIAAMFNEEQTLVHLQPFNIPGAYTWLATPHYAVPAWLNEKFQANNMMVRLPAVDVVEPRQYTYQFRGGLVDASGQMLGTVAGTYYLGEAAGQYARAIEGSYEYRLVDGRVDANTFQFVE